MRPFSSPLTKITMITLLAGVAAVAGIVGLATVATARMQVAPAGQQRGVSGGLLLSRTRDRLALCTQPVSGARATAAQARTAVAGALATTPEVARLAPGAVVEAGCPTTPYLLRPGARAPVGRPSGDPTMTRVDQPSKYRVFVFVLPQPEIDRLFGRTSLRRVAEEYLCEGDSCAEVTTGVYLSDAELQNGQLIRTRLEEALGPRPIGPPKGAAAATPTPSSHR